MKCRIKAQNIVMKGSYEHINFHVVVEILDYIIVLKSKQTLGRKTFMETKIKKKQIATKKWFQIRSAE